MTTPTMAERAGECFSCIARGDVAGAARVESSVPMASVQIRHLDFSGRRYALTVMGLSWAVERAKYAEHVAEQRGTMEALKFFDGVQEDATRDLPAYPLEAARGAQQARAAVVSTLQVGEQLLLAAEAALDDLARRFHFESDAVRAMAGVERFRATLPGSRIDEEQRQALVQHLSALVNSTEIQDGA